MLKLTHEHILSMASNEEVYRHGKEYLVQNKIVNIAFENKQKTNYKSIHAQVQGELAYRVFILFEPYGQLVDYKCSCSANFVWRGACKHVVAVLLSLLEKESASFEKNRAEYITHIFEEQLQKQIQSETTAKSAVINPTIVIVSEGRCALELSVGFDRVYIVKNIHAFLEDIRNEATVSYGKNLEFGHKKSVFDTRSQNLLEILMTIEQFYIEDVHMLRARRHLSLPGNMLDAFFELYAGEYLPVTKTDAKTESLLFCADEPPFLFTLEEEEGAVCLSSPGVNGFELVKGGHYNYIVYKGHFYRLSKNRAEAMSTIMGELHPLKEHKMAFKGEQYQRFLAFVLPVITEFDLADTSSFSPPKAKIYLDCQRKHIICTVECTNSYEESLLQSRLAQLKFVGDSGNVYTLAQEEQIYNFYLHGVSSLRQHYDVYVTDTFEKREIKKTSAKYYDVRIRGNLLELELNSPYSPAELVEAVSSFKLKKRYHRLKDGSFINLEDETMQSYMEVLSSVDVVGQNVSDDKITLPVYRALLINDMVRGFAGYDDVFEKLIRDLTEHRYLEFSPPNELKNIMRAYQKVGMQWLKTLAHYGFGGVLADEMGLGKTLQIISLLLHDKLNSEVVLPSLVVTPTSLMYNWAHEIERFAPGLHTVVLAGLPAQRKELLNAKADVFITTYDMLKRDIGHYKGYEFNYIVADEAQYIKNPSTQNAKAVKTVSGNRRFALTGTPIENSISELWSIFDFVMPGFFGSLSKFTKHYTMPIIKFNDTKKVEMLKKQTAPFILRRLKTDVLTELPDKMETNLYAEMHPEQRKIYTASLLKARGELDVFLENGESGSGKLKILAEITRLRQICCHPGLFIENYTGGSGKLDLTVEVILSAVASGHRMLLFSQFTSMLAILKETLKTQRVDYFYLDGGTDARTRTSMAEKFNNGEKSIFLISLKAGGTGLNLTGADVVIHYDEWWNPAVMNQASDRAHRYGQKNVVQVIHVVVKDSIEEKILALQNRKKDLVDSVLQQGAHFINQLTADDLRELLQEGR